MKREKRKKQLDRVQTERIGSASMSTIEGQPALRDTVETAAGKDVLKPPETRR
ncbi:MAG TPA: hypothetical protein GXX34_03820 [Clostridia bacterium]|nr:hypothetical protein [Clostridia bacterium]